MFKKSPLKATRLAQRKRKIFFLKISLYVFSGLVVFFGAVWLSHLHLFEITNISVKGNSGVETENISSLAAQNLVGPYIGLFSKYNRFIYPKDRIIFDLLQKYPRLQNVSLAVRGHNLDVSVVERTPAYTWCTGLPDDTAPKACYFMDESGYIFSTAPIFSGHAYFAFYGLVGESPIGLKYLDESELSTIQTILSAPSFHALSPYALVATKSGVFDLYVKDGTRINFYSTESSMEIIQNFETIVKKIPLFAPTSPKLDYLDLRYGNKIYYRYVGDNSATSTP